MEYLGEQYGCKTLRKPGEDCKLDCAYSFFLGVTGGAFFHSWKKGWHGDNGALFYMSDDPEAPERRALEAVGYAFHWLDTEIQHTPEEVMRQAIVESIQKGMPLLSYGIIGPPEAGIITGYDDGGKTLIGWNFFQNLPEFNAGVEFESDGQYRKRDWYRDIHSILILDGKRTRPPLKETYRQALQWGCKVMRTPVAYSKPDVPEWYRERANGLAAYTAWAEQLLQDDDFATSDEAILRTRHDVHNNAVGFIAEARWYGGQFLRQAVEYLPPAASKDLYRAAACFAEEHDLMWDVWKLAGGNGNPDAWKNLSEPAVRRAMAPIILQARRLDEEAANFIEQALTRP